MDECSIGFDYNKYLIGLNITIPVPVVRFDCPNKLVYIEKLSIVPVVLKAYFAKKIKFYESYRYRRICGRYKSFE